MKINLEELEVFDDYGKSGIYESLFAIKKPENIVYFIKKTNKAALQDENAKKYFDNEVSVNESIEHDNIVKLLQKKQILNDTYLIFESANGGNLEDCFKAYMEKNKKPFSEEIVQNIVSQIVAALKYLHENHIVFRNLSLRKSMTEFCAILNSCLRPSSKFNFIIPISSSKGTYLSITFLAFSL